MKKLLLLLLTLACAAMLTVRAASASWQVYEMPDGDLVVTDKAVAEGETITSLTLGLGETRCVEVRGASYFDTYANAYYVAHIDPDGMLVTEKVGKSKINISYTKTDSVTLTVNVQRAPAQIKLSGKTLKLEMGQQRTLTYTLPKNAAGSVSFYSANEEVVSVDSRGVLTANAPGTAQVYAETYNGHSDRCEVTVVMPAPAAINVQSSFTCYAYESFPLNATLSGGWMETLSYASSDASVCRVDEAGTVECLQAGSAVITLRASGGAVKEVRTDVLPAASAITARQPNLMLYVGGSARVEALTQGGSGHYSLESLNPDLVQVLADGQVEALKSGAAQLRLTAPGGAKCTVNVSVFPLPDELDRLPELPVLAIGESLRLRLYDDTTVLLPLLFSSSDTSVARVDQEGLIRANSRGSAQISVSAGGVTRSTGIDVLPPASEVRFAGSSLNLGEGDSIHLRTELVDGAGQIRYTSSNTAIASVSDDGTLSAHKSGIVTVTAQLKNGFRTQMEVYIHKPPQSIYPELTEVTIGEGDCIKVNCGFDVGCYSLLSWRSENEALVRVSDDGVISSVSGIGEAYAVVTASTGVRARVKVHVIGAPSDMSLNARHLDQPGLFTDYIRLEKGQTQALEATFPGYTLVHTAYASHDPTIADVSETGVITALAEGTARVSVCAYNGLTREILVEVIL